MANNRNFERLHAIVSGHVQGVNFRHNTVQEARQLGVDGWVYNRPDGTVEVTAEGPRLQLGQLEAFLHRGSPAARVEDVRVEWQPATGEFSEFGVRYR